MAMQLRADDQTGRSSALAPLGRAGDRPHRRRAARPSRGVVRIVILDEPAPGVEILVDGRVATVLEVFEYTHGEVELKFEYADGSRGSATLSADDESR